TQRGLSALAEIMRPQQLPSDDVCAIRAGQHSGRREAPGRLAPQGGGEGVGAAGAFTGAPRSTVHHLAS
ncbi:MAG: hypothetical protein ACT4NY_15630, partial [Pseudonocardiales bacterium]